MKTHVNIADALADPQLLGAAFPDLTSWATWLVVLKAAFALPLDAAELATFRKVAGDRDPPTRRVRELWCIIGRRSGKSRIAAALADYLATLTDCRSKLAAGEQGVVLVLAPSVDQAKVIRDYCAGAIMASPLLASQLETEPTTNDVRLIDGVSIAVRPNSYRTVRGRTLIASIFDECAYWRDENSALPDLETYRAVLPALATTGGMLIGIGSPYRRVGLLHQKHRDVFGVTDDEVLVVAGESRAFNPTLDRRLIAAAERDDPEGAASEWRGLFRSDLAALFDDQIIDAAIDYGRPLELPFRHGVEYFAFTDASAGRHDAFSICVGHAERDVFVCDAVRGVNPPFHPGEVAAEHATLVKSYRCRRVVGDNFSGEWVAQAFRDAGVAYARSPLTKSELYLAALPVFAQGRVRIPDLPSLTRELRMLERRTHRSGRDSVDHPPRGGSDDLANSLCGVLHCAVAANKTRCSIGFAPMFGPTKLLAAPERLRDRIRVVRVPG